ncbi:MAG: RimK/LysX family protein [Candidatus Saccharimonadales bacterium]
MDNNTKVIIGRVEIVSFPGLGIGDLHARIDTGAQTSALWASSVREKDGRLEAVLFGKGHPCYTGVTVVFKDYSLGMVASSNGQAELRYKIRTLICIGGKRIRARLTLADRSALTYPALVGRNVLRGKFIVDVKVGTPLKAAEKARSAKLQSQQKGRSK